MLLFFLSLFHCLLASFDLRQTFLQAVELWTIYLVVHQTKWGFIPVSVGTFLLMKIYDFFICYSNYETQWSWEFVIKLFMNFEFERKCEARKEYEREWEESRRKAFKLIPVVNEADVNVITQICACKSFVLPLVCHWFSHNSMHNITMLGSLYIYIYTADAEQPAKWPHSLTFANEFICAMTTQFPVLWSNTSDGARRMSEWVSECARERVQMATRSFRVH